MVLAALAFPAFPIGGGGLAYAVVVSSFSEAYIYIQCMYMIIRLSIRRATGLTNPMRDKNVRRVTDYR